MLPLTGPPNRFNLVWVLPQRNVPSSMSDLNIVAFDYVPLFLKKPCQIPTSSSSRAVLPIRGKINGDFLEGCAGLRKPQYIRPISPLPNALISTLFPSIVSPSVFKAKFEPKPCVFRAGGGYREFPRILRRGNTLVYIRQLASSRLLSFTDRLPIIANLHHTEPQNDEWGSWPPLTMTNSPMRANYQILWAKSPNLPLWP